MDNDVLAKGLIEHASQPTGIAPITEQVAIDAIVASQKAAGDPIDPNGARKLVRALIAVGLFKPA